MRARVVANGAHTFGCELTCKQLSRSAQYQSLLLKMFHLFSEVFYVASTAMYKIMG